MMLELSFGLKEVAVKVKEAVIRALDAGYATSDIALPGSKIVSCEEMGDIVVSFLAK
nr:isocitrate/isopropylmalate family dehydrogenase [Fervidicola ferrireducens]